MKIDGRYGLDGSIMLQKKVGETPLQCLERFRAWQVALGNEDFARAPMTYAGRLDPMAEGMLLVLYGDECKNKEKYLGFDKEYEVEILFGVETDTHDVLGLIEKVSTIDPKKIEEINLQKYVGKFAQKYPAYSSKTVGGKQLHAHARKGTLPEPEDMPAREIEIYSIEKISDQNVFGSEIAHESVARISNVSGDFRQDEIVSSWNMFGLNRDATYSQSTFKILKIRVACSAGTYMRSLAARIGHDLGTVAIAFSINRTKISDMNQNFI